MYVTETKTKDGLIGAIVLGDTVQSVISDCTEWMRENKLKAEQLIASRITNRESQKDIGILHYEGDLALFEPYF